MISSIGIDIGLNSIRFVGLSERFGQVHLLAAGEREGAIDAKTDGPSVLESVFTEVAFQGQRPAKTRVVLGLPQNQVFFCNFITELTDQEEVRRLLRFELEDDIPVPFEDLVTDLCGCRPVREGTHEYLIAGVDRKNLDVWVEAVDKTGRNCRALTTDVCALHVAMAICRGDSDDGPLMNLYVDKERIVLGIVDGGSTVYARHMSCTEDMDALGATLLREIELTFRAVYGKHRPRLLKINLTGPEALSREISHVVSSHQMGYEIRKVSLPSANHVDADGGLGAEYALAFGLAAVGLEAVDKTVNFLDADVSLVDKAAKSRLRRKVLVSVGLVIAILGLLGAKTFRDLQRLEAEHSRLESQMRTVYAETFPDDKKIVNELAQMSEHGKSLRSEYDVLTAAFGGKIHVLALLHIFSEKMTPDRGITVSLLSISGETVRITGTGPSFESVEAFLGELRQVSYFKSVELEDVMISRGTDRPEFKLLITVGTG